ncbi:MAG: NACHT domain-containing protein [Pseudomonadales bacterium]|nr:NACHT domain-containing protein [Pseudomonadales bacterium]
MKPGHRILIAGHPGSGKSTLVNKIAKDWSKCDIHFQSVRLLFLVHLRSFQSNPDVQLKDVVSQYFKDELDLATICSYCVKSKGLGYCFILDGLDEYQPRRKDVFIYQLIKKQCLEKAIVLTASRPAAIAEYREADKQIEVLGFFNKQISEYINSYKFSTTDRCSSLKRYLDNHPNIHHMCYLPIQSAMICFLFDVNENLPDTETQIYMEFAKHAILRSLYRYENKKHTYLESVHSLTGDDRKVFLDICSIAFEKTHASVQILLQSDVDKFNKDIKIGDSLGLITIDTIGYQSMYTFCHLTFQEFLAAYHIYCQNDEVRHKI